MKTFTTTNSKDKILSSIKKAARKMDLTIEKSVESEKTIKLYHSGGLLSFGNDIKVTISSRSVGKFLITIRSASSAEIQLIDWGLNKKLELDLANEIRDILAK